MIYKPPLVQTSLSLCPIQLPPPGYPWTAKTWKGSAKQGAQSETLRRSQLRYRKDAPRLESQLHKAKKHHTLTIPAYLNLKARMKLQAR